MGEKLFESRKRITFKLDVPGVPQAVPFEAVPGTVNRMPDTVWNALLAKGGPGGRSLLRACLDAGTVVDVTEKLALAKTEGVVPFVPVVVPPPLQVAAETYAAAKAELGGDPAVDVEAVAQARAHDAARQVPVAAPPSGPKRKRRHGVAGDEEEFYPLGPGVSAEGSG